MNYFTNIAPEKLTDQSTSSGCSLSRRNVGSK